jgi:hypothetical protein
MTKRRTVREGQYIVQASSVWFYRPHCEMVPRNAAYKPHQPRNHTFHTSLLTHSLFNEVRMYSLPFHASLPLVSFYGCHKKFASDMIRAQGVEPRPAAR